MSVKSSSDVFPSEQPELPVVAVMVEEPGDRHSLTSSGVFTVADQELSTWQDSNIDIAIFDPASLLQHERAVRSLKTLRAQEQIPILLLVSDASLPALDPRLEELADELIRTPLSESELDKRIHSLLRIRNVPDSRSLNIESSSLERRGVARALNAFCAGNDRTIQAYNEQELLVDLCTSLTHEGGYPLAWIGERAADNDNSIEPIAVSGRYSHLVPSRFRSVQQGAIWSSPMYEVFDTGRVTQISLSHAESSGDCDIAAGKRRLGSVIVFPLTVRSEQPSICLALYEYEPNLFEQDEIELLQRLVSNARRGIDWLRERFRQQRSEREAIMLAYQDGLTGLANRASIMAALDLRLKKPGPHPPATALLCVDIDGFKLLNDALGHEVGDRVLVEVSRRLRSAVQESDIVGRQGGDEFYILLSLETGSNEQPFSSRSAFDEAKRRVQQVMEVLEQPFRVGERNYHIESSIGVGMCPVHAKEAFSLLMKADSAMYEAKKISGNSYQFFSRDLSGRQKERLLLESQLYDSVETGAFEIALQPIVELNEGRVVGAEALLRWPQPDGTYISPAEFIPIAEETGLIIPIGDWVMEESLRALHRLRKQGFTNLQIAVNLAIAQLWQADLVERTLSFMRDLDIPAGALKVELTEGSLMQDVEHMEEVIRKFREAGIAVAIDDFGTGYSSLARLKSLPITTLKIDRSFLNGVPGENNAISVVNTIAHMAHNLGIKSVAEGIETEAQWQLLKELGCPLGQGFYFARPMPEKELTALLAAQAT